MTYRIILDVDSVDVSVSGPPLTVLDSGVDVVLRASLSLTVGHRLASLRPKSKFMSEVGDGALESIQLPA
jgi:hypothetical protein